MIWAAFTFEYVANVYLAEHRAAYVRAHWFDLAIVALPRLRPLRITRSVRALRLLRAGRLLALVARVNHVFREIFLMHGVQYVLATALLLLVVAAAAVAHFEDGAGGNITSFGDALWWAVTTVTTVGYGDTYPIAPEGRGIAVFVMLLGIGLFGTLTASVDTYFATSTERDSQATLDAVLAELNRLHARLDGLAPAASAPLRPIAGGEDEAPEHGAE
jgi:voltage-gated potassium channel